MPSLNFSTSTFATVSGIYIHIPFCKQACSYCDFHFSTNLKLQNELVKVICLEIESQKNYLKTPPVTLYFGGGSPSILTNENLSLIFDSLHKHFDLSQLKEVTLESNPDDHNIEKLAHWRSLGINRLSIGIQSFIDRDLQLMNRAHNSKEAKHCVEQARTAGFSSLTIDLIYGIPDQSMDEWKQNIEKAIDLKTDHISAYCLTIESKTALDHQLKKGLIAEKSDEEIELEYLYLHETLEQVGFEHYEISNFGKAGKHALHNGNYWNGLPYLGIGPSAHSFDGKNKRHWNVSNNALYIKKLKSNEPVFEFETLSERERINEEIMTGLRKKEGFNFSTCSVEIKTQLNRNLNELNSNLKSMLILHDASIQIKPEHWLLADAIIRELTIADS